MRHARTGVGRIVASFKSQVLEGYKNRTWDECVAKAGTENKGCQFKTTRTRDDVLHSKK